MQGKHYSAGRKIVLSETTQILSADSFSFYLRLSRWQLLLLAAQKTNHVCLSHALFPSTERHLEAYGS